MSCIDYSKWDNLQCSDSSSDSENDQEGWPRVQCLDQPSSVTITPTELKVTPSPQQQDAQKPQKLPPQIQSLPLQKSPAKYTRNGAETDRMQWSQTKQKVNAGFWLPSGSRSKDISLLDIQERHLKIEFKGEIFVDEDFAYPVVASEESTLACWGIEDVEGEKRRILRIELSKVAPPGVIVWWKHVLPSEPAIDLENDIPDREKTGTSWRDVWTQAHEKFREQVKERKPIEIDLNQSDD